MYEVFGTKSSSAQLEIPNATVVLKSDIGPKPVEDQQLQKSGKLKQVITSWVKFLESKSNRGLLKSVCTTREWNSSWTAAQISQ